MDNKPYETSDADARRIALLGALLALATIVIMALLVPVFWYLGTREPARTVAVEKAPAFPAPTLQVAPQEELAALRAREDAELHSYGWIDKNAGIVRIPIERAMELIVARGLPVRTPANGEGRK